MSSEQAYRKLTVSSLNVDLESWRQAEWEAQDKRSQDVRSMDYFALKTNKGEELMDLSHAIYWRSTALGKAEVQLQLTNTEMFSGNAGLIDVLAQGIRIQESQYAAILLITHIL